MNLEYRINESYDRLTANDREVLNRILRNKAQSAGMNSTELAAFCHVSRTTLIRLFKKLGIGGFAEFRLLLKNGPGCRSWPAWIWRKSYPTTTAWWTALGSTTTA